MSPGGSACIRTEERAGRKGYVVRTDAAKVLWLAGCILDSNAGGGGEHHGRWRGLYGGEGSVCTERGTHGVEPCMRRG